MTNKPKEDNQFIQEAVSEFKKNYSYREFIAQEVYLDFLISKLKQQQQEIVEKLEKYF